MKMMHGISALAMIGALTVTADAGIIAKDSYSVDAGDYNTGGLAGQSGAAEVGFTGVWSSSSANLGVDTISLNGDTTGKGKQIAAPGAFSQFSRIARRDLAPVAAPAGNTFYMSHLVNAGGSLGPNDDYAFVGFGDFTAQATIEGTANFLGGAFVGYVGNGAGGVDLVIRSRTGAAAGVVSDELLVADAENNTFQVVMALEYNNPGDTVRYWVDPTDLSNGEAGLTASSAINGSIAGFQLGAASSMNDLTIATLGFDRSFFWDESILADDVASLPEPASAMLLGLGAAALFRRR